MNRRRIAANPYLPAETNPFGQQENPSVPTNENIEQGIAPTEPEGPRVVTGPDAPETAKPRGEVVTVDASLDRMKVAVVCEACGQRGLLRLGQVSDSTRCRCGSARLELLEASRRTAVNESDWNDEGGDLVKYVHVSGDTELELVVSPEPPFKWFLWTNSPSGSDMVEAGRADDTESAKRAAETAAEFWAITVSSSRRRAEKECTCWEGYERVPGTEPCASGSCRKKTSRRRTSMRWRKSVSNGYGHWTSETLSAPDGQGSVYAVVYKDMQSRKPYAWGVVGIPNQEVDGKAETLTEAKSAAVAAMKGFTVSSSRRTASGWMQSPNPHHHYKPVVKNGYELNLFASDVDYRWAVDAMVTGDSSSLELFEQGIGTSLEDAKSQAEQSAQFFQG